MTEEKCDEDIFGLILYLIQITIIIFFYTSYITYEDMLVILLNT